MAGIVSGAIKVPEGVVSLGAELIDLGFDTDLAAKVETAFDRFNVFEEVADDRAIGKLAETIIQIGVPGGIGFKLASKAVKAKKLVTIWMQQVAIYRKLQKKQTIIIKH